MAGARVGHISIDDLVGFAKIGPGNFQPKMFDADIWLMRQFTFWLTQEMLRRGLPTMFIGDCHPAVKPEKKQVEHCLKGSGEELLVPELHQFLGHMLIKYMTKDAIDAYVDSIRRTGADHDYIVTWVNFYKLTHVIVTGIAIDMCPGSFVLSMLSANNSGIMPTLEEIVVVTKGVATFNLSREVAGQLGLPDTAIHPQAIMQHFALRQLKDRGAEIAYGLDFGDGELLSQMPANLLEDLGFEP
ncbi:MAG: isochorismatase [Candidatus Uhrbacteria bacterium]